ncbi:DUF4288 domain-containing protein [Ktedonosporobacter rubrisoli]|uniref:DUF4288 domain-containing protein n=1 Tax=Ktedonosporobacter rubrisoli TaxID=2509675 RepID=A0A4P6K4D1_KTERU|nr:DUF4288 domain-containing protein [Ktedonosporobacter rubrisoli]QBD83167.1 DUF4288 domain-containing protein [Ktedonosporobacter rubrisoli]
MQQNFYIAVLLYESAADAQDYQPLYEECFILVKAATREEAEKQAIAYAGQPYSYTNEYGEKITWSLKRIVDINKVLDDQLNGVSELYARHFRNYAAYRLFEPHLDGSL